MQKGIIKFYHLGIKWKWTFLVMTENKCFLVKLVYCSVLCLSGGKWVEVFWLTVYSGTPPYAK